MGSPYQLILLNLLHIEGALIGIARSLSFVRRLAKWRPELLAWRTEQERQLRVLIVLFKQVGGEFGVVHRFMLKLAEWVGSLAGLVVALLPISLIRFFLGQADRTLTAGLERAGHQIAIADYAEWQVNSSINPPKALLDLADARREWPSRSEGRVRFL
jgi:hypothetical protein